jgi:sulfite exporter TauE/SafE
METYFEHLTGTIPIVAGLAMGFLHVIQGPDHLAAVTPIAIDSKKKAHWIGVSWGVGHTVGALIIGILFILFKEVIPVESISHSSEIIVGVLLIVIGIWGFYKVKTPQKHTHVHKSHKQNLISSLLFGLFHGIAGIHHIIAILPTLIFSTTAGSVLYLSGFAIGTIVSMLAYSFILGRISLKSEKVGKDNSNLLKVVRIAGASFAIVVGIVWLKLSLG